MAIMRGVQEGIGGGASRASDDGKKFLVGMVTADRNNECSMFTKL
jgi:hypothetical protein